eukprot:263844_1
MIKQLQRTFAQNMKQVHKQYSATLIVDCHQELGECPLWDDINSELLWIDFSLSKLWKYNPITNKYKSYLLPERPGSFCLCHDNNHLLFSFENGPSMLSLNDIYNNNSAQNLQITNRIFEFEKNKKTVMNDGRVDRNGRFVVGGRRDFDDNSGQNLSSLYRINHDLSYQILQCDSINCTNSICFSLNGNEMYMSDTWKLYDNNTPVILKYDYFNDERLPTNPSIFTNQSLTPDGSIIDSDGFLWNANVKYGCVIRYDLNGDIDMIINVNDNPTCCTFGGDDLDILFITTINMKSKPGGFGLYAVQLPVKGVKENRFGVNSIVHD